ncbi:MAG: adenosylcobinamide-GDP ribazoletransferase, partial [Gemmatimonadales bacterium]|nr:adenosylcobinamide-GDP ribazoletransferase [Gemmatimonadales bacterium]
VATGFALGLSALVLRTAAVPLLVSTVVFVLFFGEYFRAKVGGVTGDIIGAAKEIDELVFLFTALVVFR